MRVVFNALSAYRRRTGVGSHAAHLAAALKQRAGDEVTTFPEGWLAPVAALAGRAFGSGGSAPRPTTVAHLLPGSLRAAVRGRIKGLCERSFRRACRVGRFDLYHEPNFIPWECDLPTVVTVHDLSVLLHPEWHPGERVEFHRRNFARTIARCGHVLTVSETVRLEIMANLGVRPAQVTAIANGVRPGLRPLTTEEAAAARGRLRLPEEYLLYVGAIEPRKNIMTLLRAYCALDESLRRRCPLLLAGPWAWGFEREREYYDAEARRRGVVHLGYVADADLPALYGCATALVYPSHYEGFGLPPVEMMACGGAVLASTAAALREVCGTTGHFTEPNDEAGWRDAMRRVLTDADWRAELRRGTVEHARRYSWSNSAGRVWEVYQRAIGRGVKAAA